MLVAELDEKKVSSVLKKLGSAEKRQRNSKTTLSASRQKLVEAAKIFIESDL